MLGPQFRDKYKPINNDPTRLTVMRRVRNVYQGALETHPEIHQSGLEWYERVHDAVRKSGLGTHAGAGVVTAVSPNMDFERNNIHALSEIQSMNSRHWKALEDSAHLNNRPDDVSAMLKEVAPGMSAAGTKDILQARDIARGADYHEVLNPRTSPKRHAFATNIEYPHKRGLVTVDGRQSDIVVDSMRPWGTPDKDAKRPEGARTPPSPYRGISSAMLKTGKESRYEQYQGIHQDVADALGILPHQLQAVTWEYGKQIERKFDPARSQGDTRLGQSYQHRLNEFRAGHGH